MSIDIKKAKKVVAKGAKAGHKVPKYEQRETDSVVVAPKPAPKGSK
ncbi:hypothetical protein [Fibrella forsythiae]|uniref:Uncharacterized protein n=1 Tax=Fibrella forsythiae TaxID=2817061 RepID=A0ABS3JB01_9BACT|nr:hypothetical protein [Fibrella forsythiae]MBO0947165.1 hypothetical protein [Fibrella forsythiae]